MTTTTKKIVTEVVAALKKLPSPENKKKTFWDYLKDQLYSESTWDQKDIKVIEKSIHGSLNKMSEKDLTAMWRETDKGYEKMDANKKVSPKEMKEDLTDEMLGQVMDRMDDNYSSKDSFFSPPETNYVAEKEDKGDSEDIDEEAIAEKIVDGDIDIDDADLFNDEDFGDEEESNF
ncbi:MAG: hypothetical protein CVV24_08855 [Ignavibacteriae bacterium HGW-Ignavibacteriae-3]|nr:MAG: hypothetical protein CVV24_08855 [Ignavibacteriae bacterium HGW-Ignavibacteriae-3]